MIKNSFILLEKINQKTEQNIYSQNIKDWDDFLNSKKIKGLSNKRKLYYDKKIKDAKKALYTFNSKYFTPLLPGTETWRLYDFFKDQTLFLDIEVENKKGDINIIGLYDGITTKTMVYPNLNLTLLKQELKKYKLIVTFNGSVHDIPVLKKYFSDFIPKIPHIDLRFLCQKLNLKGSLKDIEKKLNIHRPKHLNGSPVDLWKAYHASGDKEYLDLLVQYNEEDVINLKPIMEHCYGKLKNEHFTKS